MADDEVTAELEHIRACIEVASELPMTADPRRVVTIHAPRLLAAIEAVLKLPGEWSVESDGLEGGHRGLANHGADKLRTAMYARSVALKDCANQLREAITRELTGAQLGEDGNQPETNGDRNA